MVKIATFYGKLINSPFRNDKDGKTTFYNPNYRVHLVVCARFFYAALAGLELAI